MPELEVNKRYHIVYKLPWKRKQREACVLFRGSSQDVYHFTMWPTQTRLFILAGDEIVSIWQCSDYKGHGLFTDKVKEYDG